MSLSERIRPGIEAAEWVVEEVGKIEAKLAECQVERDLARGQRNESNREIERLRDQIKPFKFTNVMLCQVNDLMTLAGATLTERQSDVLYAALKAILEPEPEVQSHD